MKFLYSGQLIPSFIKFQDWYKKPALIEVSKANGILNSYSQSPQISPKESVKLEIEASNANDVPRLNTYADQTTS
ncbi:MAG: hypothetical protein IGS23_23690 [Rivularia sp. T60_A2020_040]|nr:hypothetical protein [Rivularia sp. T60_A2020_040]